jgi:hypothetical protein
VWASFDNSFISGESMHMRGGSAFKATAEVESQSRLRATGKTLGLAIVAAAIVLLQACSGASNPNYATSPNTPAPGITLQAIQITPSTTLIGLAEQRQLVATGVYSDGSSIIITPQVTWSVSSAGSTTNFVAVNSQGVATGMAIGTSIITATLGPVTGVLQLVVDTNGYTSNSLAVLSVPYKNTILDVAYLPQSLTMTQGAYAVQEVNLDADQLSNVLPVENALLASVPMPAGFVPNVTVASQSNFLVAVISYSSPDIQLIDASNISSDAADNTVVSTFIAPLTQTVTVNGITCMICAATINPLTGNLLLSTAQGFYSLDLVSGTFTAMPFSPTPAPSTNFSVNPTATPPYILSASPSTGQLQVLDLTTNAVTTVSSGLTTPGATAIDLVSGYAAVVDGATNSESLLDFTNSTTPAVTPVQAITTCGPPLVMNMAAMGVSEATSASETNATLFTSQTGTNCVGLQSWPSVNTDPLVTGNIGYTYAPIGSTTPDGNPWANGDDPNSITTFNDVYSSSHANYGLLVDANQQWIARINLELALGLFSVPVPIPQGEPLIANILCAAPQPECPPGNVVFLPTPSTAVTLSVNSINFGSVAVGTASPLSTVAITDISPNFLNYQITVGGANPGDFTVTNTCNLQLSPHSSCPLVVTFTPTAQGPRSAVIDVTAGTAAAQTIALSGTGT